MRKVLSIETILCMYMHAHMQTPAPLHTWAYWLYKTHFTRNLKCAPNRDLRWMKRWTKTATQNGNHGRSVVLGKETSWSLTWMSPGRVSVGEEGEVIPCRVTEDRKGAGTNSAKFVSVFLCVQTVVCGLWNIRTWGSLEKGRFKIPLVLLLLLFIMCVPVLVHAIAHKGYENSIKESSLKVDSESEIPCHTALSVLHLAFPPHFCQIWTDLLGSHFCQKMSVEYMYVHEQN